MMEPLKSTQDRLTWIFRRAVSRPPSQTEQGRLRSLFEEQRDRYRKNRDAAADLVQVGQAGVPRGIDESELAAWTAVCRAILNLHETITRS